MFARPGISTRFVVTAAIKAKVSQQACWFTSFVRNRLAGLHRLAFLSYIPGYGRHCYPSSNHRGPETDVCIPYL